MRGVLSKVFVEQRLQCLGFCLGLATIMALLTSLLPKVLGDIHHVFERLPFLKPLITALLGVDPGEQMSGAMSQAFLWVHPTVLTLIWAHEVIYCTRFPAAEIDKGTIDFLLGLPVSRMKLYLCELVGWALTGVLILSCGYFGHLLASIYHEPDMRPPTEVTAYVMINLFSVYFAVGGFAFLVSSVSDRRGRAMGIVFAVLLTSFLINFVAQFWDPLKANDAQTVSAPFDANQEKRPKSIPSAVRPKLLGSADFLSTQEESRSGGMATFSVMHYYRPAIVIQNNEFPTTDVGILLSVGFVCLVLAGLCINRRSICTV